MNRTQTTRRPHTLTLATIPAVVLKFWTAQAVEIASQAAECERTGNMARAADLWGMAGMLSPADAYTKAYCIEHSKVAA